ncbi:MAG: hypothetical protein PVH19_13315, partial [Planctomycetia bacterium]
MSAHLHVVPQKIMSLRKETPKPLVLLLEKLLAKKPQDRLQTPAEVVTALEPLAAGSDLPKLIEECHRIEQAEEEKVDTQASMAAEAKDTQANRVQKPTPQPAARGGGFRRKARWIALGAVPLFFLLGVIIWVNNKHKIEVPDGSTVRMGQNGEVTVIPPGSTKNGRQDPVKGPVLTPKDIWREPGAPLCRGALVQEPKSLPGVRGWTIVPRKMSEEITSVKFSPTSDLVAGVERTTGIVRVWNATTGVLHRVLVPQRDADSQKLVWSPDGRYLATSSTWAPIQIWDVESGQLVRRIGEPQDIELAWSPDGKYIAAGKHQINGFLNIYDVDTGKRMHQILTDQGHLSAIDWSPDGKTIVTGRDGSHHTVRFWDPSSGKEQHQYDKFFETTSDLKGVIDIKWSPDNRFLAVFGWDSQSETICFFDGKTGELLEREKTKSNLAGWILEMAWSPDSTTLAVAGAVYVPKNSKLEKEIVIDAKTGKRMENFAVPLLCTAICVDWSADGKKLVTVLDNGETCLWHPSDMFSGRPMSRPTYVLAKEVDPQQLLGFSGDGRYLLTRDEHNSQLFVWESASGKLVTNQVHAWDAALSPDGLRIACQGKKKGHDVFVWDIKAKNHLCVIKGNVQIQRIVWAPDGNSLALLSDHWRCFDPTTGKLVAELPELQGPAAWSPDGKSFAVVKQDKIVVCDATDGKLLRESDALPETPQLISWSPDGKRFVVSGKEKILVLSSTDFRRQHVKSHSTPEPHLRLYWLDGGQHILVSLNRDMLDTESGKIMKVVGLGKTDGSVSPDGKWYAERFGTQVEVFRINPVGNQSPSPNVWARFSSVCREWVAGDVYLSCPSNGQFTGSPGIADQLVYVVETNDGRQTMLSSAEFAQKYGDKKSVQGTLAENPVPDKTTGPKPPTVAVKADPTAYSIPLGDRLCSGAMMNEPTPVHHIQSWTIEPRSFRCHVKNIAFSPDGRMVAATGVRSLFTRVWDTTTGKLIRIFASPGEAYTGRGHLAWSPDSKFLAIGEDNERFGIWEMASGKRMTGGRSGHLTDLAWSPDGRTLAVADRYRLFLWDPASGKTTKTLATNKPPRWFVDVTWSPDGKTLAVGENNGQVTLWDMKSEEIAHTLQTKSCVRRMVWSPDGSALAVATDRTYLLNGKDLSPLKVLASTLPGAYWGMAWSADGKFLFGDKWIYDVRSEKFVKQPNLPKWWGDAIVIACSPNGEKVAAGSQYGAIWLWDSPGQMFRHDPKASAKILSGHVGGFSAATLSRDGSVVAHGGYGFSPVWIWSTETGKLLGRFESTRNFALSPDGSKLI